MSTNRFDNVRMLQQKVNGEWKSIDKAIATAEDKLSVLTRLLVPPGNRPIAEDASVVFFGSLARGECTSKSDLDWIVLIDGQVDEQHYRTFQTVRKSLIEAQEIRPGNTGLFGGMAFSHDIVHRIGGEDDTNRNLTLRMLLLLESTSVGDDAARKRVVRAILRRYLADDPSWTRKSDGKIRRFLFNDSVRFWRTMAVDFADKFHDQAGEKWALRNTKLRFSRKLIFLASVLACFSWHLHRPKQGSGEREQPIDLAQAHFDDYLSRPPLDIVADELLLGGISDHICNKIFASYNEFLSIIDDSVSREELVELPRELAEKSKLFQRIRELSHIFHQGLLEWLFNTESEIFKLVRDYALF